QVQLKRAEIELRHAQADAAATSEKKRLLATDIDARRAEVEAYKAPIKPLMDELSEVRREVAQRLGQIAAMQEAVRQIDRGMGRAVEIHAEAVGEVAVALRDALVSLAEAARATDQDAVAGSDFTERARLAVDTLRARERELKI